MEGGATERAVWSCRMEEDVDPPTVHKKSCNVRFHAKDPLAKAIQGSQLGVKEVNAEDCTLHVK